MPAKNDGTRSKVDALLEEGTLNPAPEKVSDPKFQESEFFDPRDAVQVKYEMLRRVSVENASVTDAVRRVRRLAADLLPGQGELRRGRHCGAGAQEAGPARSAQAPAARCWRSSRRTARPGRADPGARAGDVDPAASSASTCIRGRSSARSVEKKLPDDAGCRGDVFARSHRPSPPSTRRCAWPRLVRRCRPRPAAGSRSFFVEACGAGRGRWPPRRATAGSRFAAPSSSPTAPCERSAVIHVFAAMAMKTTDRRAP